MKAGTKLLGLGFRVWKSLQARDRHEGWNKAFGKPVIRILAYTVGRKC